MREDDGAEREDGGEEIDAPEGWGEPGHDDHHGGAEDAEDEHVLEALDDLPDLPEEGRRLDFLGRRTPAHIDGEHVREKSLTDMEGETAEENNQEEDPLVVFVHGPKEATVGVTVAQDRERQVADSREDDDDGEEDLERVDVIVVQEAVEPADSEVVEQRQDPGRADGVVSTDVSHDGEFRRQRHAGPDEVAEELGERPAHEPVADRVEEQLVAAVGVFLPPGQFVVHGQRDAFLEAVAGVGGEADDVAVALQPQSHVEVLGHRFLGPVFLRVGAVGRRVGDVLHRGPAEDGVVADEGGDVAVGDGEGDGGVDEVGEEGDAVFEEAVGDVHHARAELDDGHFRGLFHFADGVEEAIGGDAGVGVDEKDVVTDADVAFGPCSALVFRDDLRESSPVALEFFPLCPVLWSLNSCKLIFDAGTDGKGVVHVGSLLEFSRTNKAHLAIGRLGVVLGTSYPADVVFIVEVPSGLGLLLRDKLQTVIVDKDVSSTALHFVS